MKQVKTFIVEGQQVTLNGKKVKDIAKKVDVAVNEFLSNLDGEFVDIKITPQFSGASGDYAFVTIVFDGKAPAKEVVKGKK